MTQINLMERCAELETKNLHLQDEIAHLRDRMTEFERLVELLRELLGVQ